MLELAPVDDVDVGESHSIVEKGGVLMISLAQSYCFEVSLQVLRYNERVAWGNRDPNIVYYTAAACILHTQPRKFLVTIIHDEILSHSCGLTSKKKDEVCSRLVDSVMPRTIIEYLYGKEISVVKLALELCAMNVCDSAGRSVVQLSKDCTDDTKDECWKEAEREDQEGRWSLHLKKVLKVGGI